MIGVVDFGAGNLFSLFEALGRLNLRHRIVERPVQMEDLSCLLLPGVGAFGEAIARLTSMGMVEPIRGFAASGRRLVGICLGMQMLVDGSDEFGFTPGLSLIPGRARRIPDGGDNDAIRIPNIGWRRLVPASGIGRLALPDDFFAYFVHSYYVDVARDEDLTAWIPVNGARVAAIIERDNVCGLQFHPEKSGEQGIDLLNRLLQSAPLSTLQS